jgi:hypothetical protein
VNLRANVLNTSRTSLVPALVEWHGEFEPPAAPGAAPPDRLTSAISRSVSKGFPLNGIPNSIPVFTCGCQIAFVRWLFMGAQVDPIVASFCGGSVGVLSALLVVEVNNVKKQQASRCLYCEGRGYLACGACCGAGRDQESGGAQCAFCAGTGKVMCTSCLCTGKQMATEHDPRIDPFNA